MTPEDLAAVGLSFRVDGPLATLCLERPQVRNAQTPAMWSALAEIGRSVPDSVRLVVVRGRGSSFSAGLDRAVLDPANPEGVGALLALDPAAAAEQIGAWQEGFTWLRDPRFVSLAVVQGHAVGAGFQLALACDLRMVADDVSFAMKESALGLVPDLTGTQPLVAAVGYARALELCATARAVGAEEAVRIGLALSAHPLDELDSAFADLAAALVGTMPGVLSETKALLLGATDRDLDTQRTLERTAQVRRFHAVARAMRGA